MSSAARVAIDDQNPWPGLGAFDEASQQFFNGRGNETAELRRLVLNSSLTVLFGASGLGKTSLIQAGLFPSSRKEHFLPIYVRLDVRDKGGPLIEQVKFALQQQVAGQGIDAPPFREAESLWEYLHRPELELWSPRNQLLTPLFVFDQFEEVFTLGTENAAATKRLRADLADLIENRVPDTVANAARAEEAVTDLALDSQRYRIVLSFREDFLPAVESWKRDLPSILRNRLRLLPMSQARAFEAVYQTAPNLVSDALAHEIVQFVAAARGNGSGKAREAIGEEVELSVEPALLSLVCHGLNEKRKALGKAAFDQELVADSKQFIVSKFYEDAVGDLPRRVQDFIANELITERGFRKSCDVDDARSLHGVTNEQLHLLVNRRILRIEPQRGTERVELTHDLLTPVVREHRSRQREKRRVKRQRRRMFAFAVIAVLLAGLTLEFKRQANKAVKQAEIADEAKTRAELMAQVAGTATDEAFKARDVAKTQAGIAEANRLEAVKAKDQAERETRRNLAHELAEAAQNAMKSSDLGLSRLLALEAVSVTYRIDKSVDVEAQQALEQAVQDQTRPLSPSHTGTVRAVAYSQDGSRLATASVDGTARVWDVTSGLCLLVLSGSSGPMTAVAFSPDGKSIATGSEDRTVKIWDARSGAELAALTGHLDGIRIVAFSRDGTRLGTASVDGMVKLWDTRLWKELHTFPAAGTVQTAAFNSDGTELWTVSNDGTVKRWDTVSYKELPNSLCPPNKLTASAFSSDLSKLATVSENGTLQLWDTDKGTSINRPQVGLANAIIFSSDGKLLAVATRSAKRLLDADSLKERIDLKQSNNDLVGGLAFSPDTSRRRLAAGSDNAAIIWDADQGQKLVTTYSTMARSAVVAIRPDGLLFVVIDGNGMLAMWDPTSSLELFTLMSVGTRGVRCSAFSPDGHYFAAVMSDGAATVWDTGDVGHPAKLKVTTPGPGTAIALSNDGRRLATTGKDGLRIWNVDSGGATAPLADHRGDIRAVVFSPDPQSKQLITAGADRTAKVRNGSSGEVSLTIPSGSSSGHTDAIDAAAVSPDGTRLATASRDKTVRFWDIKSGEELGSVAIDGVYTLAFSPDGSRLVTASRARSSDNIRLWNTKTNQELLGLSVELAQSSALRLAFHPDGKSVVAAYPDGLSLVYPLEAQDLLNLAWERLNRPWTDHECQHHFPGEQRCPQWAEALSYVVQGDSLARAEKADEALASFKKARELDPKLQLDAQTMERQLEARALLLDGRKLAWIGDEEGALARFQKAKKLDPALRFDPIAAARLLTAPLLVAKGHNLAMSGNLNDATTFLQKAKDLDPGSMDADPQAQAGKWAAEAQKSAAQNWKTTAENQASDLDGAMAYFQKERGLNPALLDEVTASYQEAKTLDSTLELDPATEARKRLAPALASKGRELARSGSLEDSIAVLRKASELDPKLNIKPEVEANRIAAEALAAKALSLVQQDQLTEATSAYSKAVTIYAKIKELDPDGKVRANAWNELCWNGSVRGHAAAVMNACEQALVLDPNNEGIRDSRGLARALSGNISGAIADFQFFIDHSDRTDRKPQRQRWVTALRAGQNPFTPEEMATLVGQ